MIYFLVHKIHPVQTGGERYNSEVLNAFRESGIPVTVWTDDQLPFRVRRRNILRYNFWYLRKCLRIRNEILFTTNYMHLRLWMVLPVVKLLRRAKICVLNHCPWNRAVSNPILRGFMWLLELWCFNWTDIIIVNSHNTKKEVQRVLFRAKPIHVLYPGIESETPISLTLPKTGRNLLFVGTPSKLKGIGVLLDALTRLSTDSFRLHIVGSLDSNPKYGEWLREKIKKANLSDQIILHGFLEGQKKWQMFASADIFILSSLWESFGIVAAEAMYYGLPIIATNVGALPEIVEHGENGLLVSPGDSKGLANAIELLLTRPDLRESYGQAGREKAKKFVGWEAVRAEIVRIIKENCPEIT